METKIFNGNNIPATIVDELIQLSTETFNQHRSPIPLARSASELKDVLTNPDTAIITVYDDDQLIGFTDVFPTCNQAADKLMPWIDFSFYRNELKGLPWFISAIVIKQTEQNKKCGKFLLEAIKNWRDQNKIGIISFDCNTFYSGFLPQVIAQIGGPELLFPDVSLVKLLALAGEQGLHANPVWFMCLDKIHYDQVKNVFLALKK